MTDTFLDVPLDFSLLLSGLAFILLGIICITFRSLPNRQLPWKWLALFGLTFGSRQWLEIYTLGLGEGPVFSFLRLMVLGLSCLFLMEFGREGWLRLKGWGPGRWIHLAVPSGMVVVHLTGLTGISTVLYDGIAAGALAASVVLFLASKTIQTDRYLLGGAALGTAGVGVSSVFSPAPLVIGLPTVVIVIALSVWGERVRRLERRSAGKGIHPKPEAILIVLLSFVIWGGWMLCEFTSREIVQDVRRDLLNHASVSAASLNTDQVKKLSGTRTDLKSLDYRQIREQLMEMQSASPDFRWLYLMFLKDGKIPFAVDSVPEGLFGHVDPGVYYERPPQGLLEIFRSGTGGVIGPYTDEYGSFISGFAPIRDPLTGKVLGVLGVDVNVKKWRETTAFYRLFPLSIMILFIMISLVGFTADKRQRETRALLAESEQRLIEAQRVARLGNWAYDPRTGKILWSEEMFRILGFNPGDPAPAAEEFERWIHPDDRTKFRAILQNHFRDGKEWEEEFRIVRPDGAIRHVHSRGGSVRGRDGTILELLGTTQDVTARKELEEQLRELALVDELTGMNNRRQFFSLATHQLKVASRLNKKVVLIYADLDNMKWINDTLGHHEGDRALADTAGILKRTFRSSDIVARLGGDEFAGLVIATAPNAGSILLERLEEAFNEHNIQSDKPYKLSISFGMTEYDPGSSATLEELLEEGDRVMYEQKKMKKMARTA